MATFKKRPSGRWQAQVQRKGHSLSETFALRKDAEAWARHIQNEIDSGKTPARKNMGDVKTFGALIDLHIEDMKEVGKVLGRSKAFSLELLKNRLGKVRFENLDREQIIQFGKERAKEGAGPVTLGIDIGHIGTLLTHGAPFTAFRCRRSRSTWLVLLIKCWGLSARATSATGGQRTRNLKHCSPTSAQAIRPSFRWNGLSNTPSPRRCA